MATLKTLPYPSRCRSLLHPEQDSGHSSGTSPSLQGGDSRTRQGACPGPCVLWALQKSPLLLSRRVVSSGCWCVSFQLLLRHCTTNS